MRSTLLLLLALVLATSRLDAYPPYHDISDTAAAQAEARERQLPLAYLGYVRNYLVWPSPAYNSEPELTQMALRALQGRAVVIAFNGDNMGPVPTIVHAQYHIHDDGPLNGGAAWLVPKIVFADPDITKTLGRVSETQMAAGRESPIETALDAIDYDPTALTPKPKPKPVEMPAGDDTDDTTPDSAPPFGTLWWGVNLIEDRWPFFVAGSCILVLAVIAWAVKNL